ncbi:MULTISPECIES: hypothetical protein [unclassified Streptomyces]|uniref:LppU/SCO3897 family protein n=1 Tax=unclassified Streptomyces TaxID=2593676 RepID=UPI0008DE6430|nr:MULTISPECIES: hypothetical protein [unclassified Streptomyces]OII68890.1 hypothetical protein BJP39_19535 [Streptomyces sp. CC77]
MTTPPQNVPGQPGQPVEPGQPVPGQPFPEGQFGAPEQPKKKSIGKKILGVLALIVVALVVKLGIPYVLTGPTHAEAGDCVQVTGPDNSPEVEKKECSEGGPDLYKVVKVVDDTFDVERCGESGESALAQQWNSEKFVLCLDPVKG